MPQSKQSKRQPSRPSQPVRLLNPLEALVLTRERVQEVLDDAVARGRMTRDDAADCSPSWSAAAAARPTT